LGLFGSKKTESPRSTSTGAASDTTAAGKVGSQSDSAASTRSNTTAKNTKQAKGSSSKSGSRSDGSKNRAGHDRGTAPPTGGESVATIGKSIIIKGDLSGDEDLIIEGKVEGRVQLPNNEITVGSDGRITADIEAKSIIVIGQTAGNLNASERVEVQSGATVQGDIAAPKLQIQEGAVVNGSISMTKSPVSATATTRDPKAASPIEEQARKIA
jgi:cytoskeletal protein CcmA (bactofilin family)